MRQSLTIVLTGLAVLGVAAPAGAAQRRVALKTAQAKVLRDFTSVYDTGTYKATCKRARAGRVTCTIVKIAGEGPCGGRGSARYNRRGRIVATSFPLEDCAGLPGANVVDTGPAPAPDGAPAPPAPAEVAPPPPPTELPNPAGYYRGQGCKTVEEASYNAAGFTCQASGAESCIYTDFGTTCIPIYVLFPLNADGTVGGRR